MLGSSITYRIAVGPHEGRKAFCLQSLLPAGSLEDSNPRVARVAGFSLHAGVAAARHERRKLERLCRYITRPAIAEPRLSLTPAGNVRYQLKTPYRDGTTHVIFEPLDFMARLAALVPRPRVNLTRYHGVFAFNISWRGAISSARSNSRNSIIGKQFGSFLGCFYMRMNVVNCGKPDVQFLRLNVRLWPRADFGRQGHDGHWSIVGRNDE